MAQFHGAAYRKQRNCAERKQGITRLPQVFCTFEQEILACVSAYSMLLGMLYLHVYNYCIDSTPARKRKVVL